MTDNPIPDLGCNKDRRSWHLKFLSPAIMSRSSSSSKYSSARMMADGTQLSPATGLQNEEDLQKQDLLVSFILGGGKIEGTLINCSTWYLQYLQFQITSHWHLLKITLAGLNEDTQVPHPGEFAIVFDFLLIVAQQLKLQKNLTLVDVVDELDNENKVKPQSDQERAAPNQIVFAAMGWLTMLYEAVSHPSADKLEVTGTSTSLYGMRHVLNTRKYYTYRLGFEYIDLPLHNLISRFGDLIPEARSYNKYEPPALRDDGCENLYLSSVCFQALHDFAELKIEWVTSLSLHLELDSSKKTVKMFQFPSYCRLMIVERSNNLLSRLLNDYGARLGTDVIGPDTPTDKFFEEVLLTYRLIFGQHERSWNLFKQIIPAYEEQLGRSSEGVTWDFDPLLRILCGKSCTEDESYKIYQELGSSDTASYYNSHEFPFFGKRLFELQKLVNVQPPQNIRALWTDRRDVAVWWANWNPAILIAVASFTIFLVILQLVFQILQFFLRK